MPNVKLTVIIAIILASFSTATWDVYGQALTNDPNADFAPGVDGNYLTYVSGRSGNFSLILQDLTTGDETQLTDGLTEQPYPLNPSIDGTKIVYQYYVNGQSEIYLYDISARFNQRLTTDAIDQLNPKISKDKIIWIEYGKGGSYVVYYDMNFVLSKPLTDPALNVRYASIENNIVVYAYETNGQYDLHLYDLSTNTETPLAATADNEVLPQIKGGQVAYLSYPQGGSSASVYVYDIASQIARKITPDGANASMPAIGNGIVAYPDDRNGNWDIYAYDLNTSEEVRVTSSALGESYPQISRKAIYYHQFDPNVGLGIDIHKATLVGNMSGSGMFLKGDADWDGELKQADATAISSYVNTGSPVLSPLLFSDANGDAKVDASDSSYISAHLTGGPSPPGNYYGLLGVVMRGDVNFDGVINVFDVTLINKIAFQNFPAPDPSIVADAKPDGKVDIFDVAMVNDAAFKNGALPLPIFRGDVNNDVKITKADVAFLESYLSGGPAPAPIVLGDANGDGSVNRKDVNYILEYLSNFGPWPVGPYYGVPLVPTPTPGVTAAPTAPPGGNNNGGGSSNPGGDTAPKPSPSPNATVKPSPTQNPSLVGIDTETDEILRELHENGKDTTDVEEQLLVAQDLEMQGRIEESEQVKLGALARLKVMLANLKAGKISTSWLIVGALIILILAGTAYYYFAMKKKDENAEKSVLSVSVLGNSSAGPSIEMPSGFEKPEVLEPIKLDLMDKKIMKK
ncbi:MAG: dockerin type I domain-containing protein [Candidatus Micrarchaeota archaeon]